MVTMDTTIAVLTGKTSFQRTGQDLTDNGALSANELSELGVQAVVNDSLGGGQAVAAGINQLLTNYAVIILVVGLGVWLLVKFRKMAGGGKR